MQSCITNSSKKVEYITNFEVTKDAFCLRKFLMGLGVVPLVVQSLILFCNNSGIVT